MVLPAVLPWMKEPNQGIAFGISAIEERRLIEIAGTAGQRKIRFLGTASASERHDVLDLEWEIEDRLRGVAILTPMPCTECNLGIVWIHCPKASASVAARVADARNSASTSASNSICSSTGRVWPRLALSANAPSSRQVAPAGPQ